jgi:hypothetical protein
MSRIIIARYEDQEEHMVCGWDNPLKSYFFQVVRAKDDPLYDDDMCSLRLGYNFQEFPTPLELRRGLGKNDIKDVITDEVAAFLRVTSAMGQNTIIDLTSAEDREKYNCWRPLVQTAGEAKWNGNGLVFATREEAERSAEALAARWLMVTNTAAGPAVGPANYTNTDGYDKKIEAAA